ncbi:hypothetical protein PYK79_46435 [Streptomyces sp. ID05-04B]|uniref:hypothetical protein n=1 Tax=Streptomyces sp. ID05-04B TaxID=3028661 RepID=UPI0029C3C760|nr:hypothetical protein [Streptomyces sp. ID05-04B]MDX5569245.1 hypothetical protein [Streptomyces sp. ID05-04B]
MARIQILELPTEHHGDDMTTPFVLVIDQAPRDESISQAFREDLELSGKLAERLGARTVLCFEDTIEIPANEVPVDENGVPIRFAVEGDYTRFREQLDLEIRTAQQRLAEAGLSFEGPRPVPTSARIATHEDPADPTDAAL